MHQFFNFPLSYFCGKILNVIPSKYYEMENIIKNNKSLIVYLGGVRETFSASEKEEILYIKKRRGIFRIALENNIPLLPIYTFGITELYEKSNIQLIIPFLFNDNKISWYFGKYNTPFPMKKKLVSVVGKPIVYKKIKNTITENDITTLRNKYIKSVIKLFNTWKIKFPSYKDKILIIR